MWASRPSSPHCTLSPLLRIDLKRSGGFAGLTTPVGTLDTSELSDGEAREVEELYRKAGVDDLARRSPVRGGGADRFQYHLTIEDEAGRRDVTVAEDQMPDALRPLIERVRVAGADD